MPLPSPICGESWLRPSCPVHPAPNCTAAPRRHGSPRGRHGKIPNSASYYSYLLSVVLCAGRQADKGSGRPRRSPPSALDPVLAVLMSRERPHCRVKTSRYHSLPSALLLYCFTGHKLPGSSAIAESQRPDLSFRT